MKVLISFFLLISLLSSFAFAKKKTQKISLSAKVEKLFNQKKYNQVIDVLAGKWSRAKLESLSYLSSSLSELKQYSRQIKVLEYIKEKKPKQYIWYYKLGLAYENLYEQSKKQEYRDTAAKKFRKTIEINPKFKPGYNKLLKMFAKEGNLYEGRTIASVILREFGATPEVSQSLCRLYSLDGYIQEAIGHCSTAISEEPKFGDNYMYLANTFLDRKDKVTAKKIFSKAAQDFPRSEFVQLTTGDFNFSESSFNAAYKNYRRAYKLNKESKAARIGLAQALFKLNKPAKALPHYIAACKLDSRYLKEFKVAAGNLLTTGQDIIYNTYESSLHKCHK